MNNFIMILGWAAFAIIVCGIMLMFYLVAIEPIGEWVWNRRITKGIRWLIYEKRKVRKIIQSQKVKWMFYDARRNANIVKLNYPNFVSRDLDIIFDKWRDENGWDNERD